MSRLPTVQRVIEEGIAAGLHPGAQLYVSQGGDVAAEAAVGVKGEEDQRAEDQGGGGASLRSDHLLPWLSATKPIVAVAAAQQWEQGRFGLDQPVAEVIPEFGVGGKAPITLRHVLTHTGGIPNFSLSRYQTWDDRVAAVAAAPLAEDWTPGQTAAYHPVTSWYILGEMIRRVTGQPLRQYVRERIFEPLGMDDCWIGMSGEQYDAYVAADRMGVMFDTRNTSRSFLPRTTAANKATLTCTSPGSSGCGPVRQLGRFYEMLLGGGQRGDGPRILEQATVEHWTRPHRTDLIDRTFKYPMTWGLGFILEAEHRRGAMPYGYGQHASAKTFGHSGMQCSAAFADPVHNLVVAIVFNGMPGEPRHQRRIDAVLAALYEDLGLA